MIEKLGLKNFTAFESLELEFSPKINVIIGENSTGKTHLLKAAYALCLGNKLGGSKSETKTPLERRIGDKLVRIFCPKNDQLGRLHRNGAESAAEMSASFVFDRGVTWSFSSSSKRVEFSNNVDYDLYSWIPTFIPTEEVFSLVHVLKDGTHDANTIAALFDDGHLDLATQLLIDADKDLEEEINANPRLGTVIPALVNLLGGRFELNEGRFEFQEGAYEEKRRAISSKASQAKIYQDSTTTKFVPRKGCSYSTGMTAEGFKKLGMLHRLLANGSLFPSVSGPLFWDEPESNLNPKLTKILVEVLLELSRNGQQIVLATHDYVLLKWFDLLSRKESGDAVRYHRIFTNEETGVLEVDRSDDFSTVAKSAISDAFAELFDEDVKRALG